MWYHKGEPRGSADFLDRNGDVLAPSDGNIRQYKSDTSTKRSKRCRREQRNVAATVRGAVAATALTEQSRENTTEGATASLIEVTDYAALRAWDRYGQATNGKPYQRNKRGGWCFPTKWPPETEINAIAGGDSMSYVIDFKAAAARLAADDGLRDRIDQIIAGRMAEPVEPFPETPRQLAGRKRNPLRHLHSKAEGAVVIAGKLLRGELLRTGGYVDEIKWLREGAEAARQLADELERLVDQHGREG